MGSSPPDAEDLDRYVATYASDPFERENQLTIEAHVQRCIRYFPSRGRYLELGIGHGLALARLSEAMQSVLVLDASPALVTEYSGRHDNVSTVESYFEAFETDERFGAIGMGFVLEHVDDPAYILDKFSGLLAAGGSIFASVPNAGSMHRRIGQLAGMLDDLGRMSETDRAFGHKRFWTHEQWCELFERQGLAVVRSEGLYLKPFSQGQMQQLGLEPSVYRALVTLANDHVAIANSCFYQLTLARGT